MSGNRAENYRAVKALRDRGMLQREISSRTGLSRSYVSDLLTDPDGSSGKSRKDSYRGSCVVCGTPTDGSNGAAAAPRYCLRHAPGSPEMRAKTTWWTRERIVSRIREWAEIYGEPPAAPDWGSHMARECNDEARAVRFEKAAGHWPHFTTVHRRFGSWNAGIETAGFPSRPPGGGGGNETRRRSFQNDEGLT